MTVASCAVLMPLGMFRFAQEDLESAINIQANQSSDKISPTGELESRSV